MDRWLAVLGVLFALFLVMAAAVGMNLETGRGLLERIGITWLKGGVSLDDAMKISAEFVPAGSAAAAKVAALAGMASQSRKVADETITKLQTIKNDLARAGGEPTADLIEQVSQAVSGVRQTLEASERRRVFFLRVISAVIGVLLAGYAEFDAIHLAAKSATEAGLKFMDYFAQGPGWTGYLITGIAASSGSSYWHDKLDNIRSLKGAVAQAAGRASG